MEAAHTALYPEAPSTNPAVAGCARRASRTAGGGAGAVGASDIGRLAGNFQESMGDCGRATAARGALSTPPRAGGMARRPGCEAGRPGAGNGGGMAAGAPGALRAAGEQRRRRRSTVPPGWPWVLASGTVRAAHSPRRRRTESRACSRCDAVEIGLLVFRVCREV